MALLSFEEEFERARDGRPFANGFEFESWSSIWCDECALEDQCPLLSIILENKTPYSWEDKNPGALNRYHCWEFESRGSGEQTAEVPLPGSA